MKSYAEIDLSGTPIVVLGCGHFFTAESLDGMMGMDTVYSQDIHGGFTGVQDVSAEMASKVPCCPDCQCPIRQYCTKRSNRIINRAVIDEMSKRFLVNGKTELREIERLIADMEEEFEATRGLVITSISQTDAASIGGIAEAKVLEITQLLNDRDERARRVKKSDPALPRKVL